MLFNFYLYLYHICNEICFYPPRALYVCAQCHQISCVWCLIEVVLEKYFLFLLTYGWEEIQNQQTFENLKNFYTRSYRNLHRTWFALSVLKIFSDGWRVHEVRMSLVCTRNYQYLFKCTTIILSSLAFDKNAEIGISTRPAPSNMARNWNLSKHWKYWTG